MKSKMYICVKAQREGFHCYPDAPELVSYLRNLHRHVFHVEVELMVVGSEDRELEFFMVQAQLKKILDEIFNFDIAENKDLSCEKIATAVQLKMQARYPGVTGRPINVRVSEDGENGVYLVNY